ncbi:hypothetical protein LCGC14_2030010 [marine sediment metagenome]|uniref:Methyltransferase type 11 domain-containing protein n=1 Tax=marine sediment metagenome TaxID=412755 RepID=A0A0F9EV54_9ZZZZ
MHPEVQTFLISVKKMYPNHFRDCTVLDVGSRDVNGTPRIHFDNCDYIGCDIISGNGVDLVMPVDRMLGKYKTIVCTEMLEHDKHWKISLEVMRKLMEPCGLLIITAAGPNRLEHGTRRSESFCSPGTPDYYRNISKEDLQEFSEQFLTYEIKYARNEQDIQFTGIGA